MADPRLTFEHAALNRVRRAAPDGRGPGRRWLVAVSGGVDSLALAEFARRWRAKLCDRLVIAHVHHGLGSNRQFRDRAQAHVRAWARDHDLPFITNVPAATSPADEAGLRRLRYGYLERWRRRFGLDLIALAHHRDDLVETRVQRLIRGTSDVGLGAMHVYRSGVLRPLLGQSRAQIESYARGRGLTWLEDPTNAQVDGLRGWLRHEWLPALERRCPGAGAALARSLEMMAASGRATGEPASALGRVASLRRDAWRELAPAARAAAARDYLTALGARDFGASHVHELVKRLDSQRKQFSFEMCGFVFHVTREHWWALSALR